MECITTFLIVIASLTNHVTLVYGLPLMNTTEPWVHKVFAKIPQDLNTEDFRNLFADMPNPPQFSLGSTNQVGRILIPRKRSFDSDNGNVMNIPLFMQPYEDYKILVVRAPQNARMFAENGSKPLVVYILFPEDRGNFTAAQSFDNLPVVYFVNSRKEVPKRSTHVEPIILVDNKRTVTGLKSKEISKYIRFRNKFLRSLDSNHLVNKAQSLND